MKHSESKVNTSRKKRSRFFFLAVWPILIQSDSSVENDPFRLETKLDFFYGSKIFFSVIVLRLSDRTRTSSRNESPIRLDVSVEFLSGKRLWTHCIAYPTTKHTHAHKPIPGTTQQYPTHSADAGLGATVAAGSTVYHTMADGSRARYR